ncbi:MAG: response regulator transcription factor [Eubacterium sp.]|nr:response regulator transcription factor [Eubacterium sp.]
MNIAIVDDLPNEIENLRGILAEYSAAVNIDLMVDEFSCGEEFLETYAPFEYTVIFLDIYMGGITGIETAETIRKTDRDTIIIFLTTSSEHMGSAFSIHAFDYIGKPAKKEKIFQVMDDILKRHTTIYSQTLEFASDRQNHSIPVSDIVSIRTAESNYLEITDRSTVYHPRMTFSGVCDELKDEPSFILINRGILVNMDYIVKFRDGECFLKNGRQYPVFTKKMYETEKKWQNYIFNKVRNKQKDARKAMDEAAASEEG